LPLLCCVRRFAIDVYARPESLCERRVFGAAPDSRNLANVRGVDPLWSFWCAARPDSTVVMQKRISRGKLLETLAQLPVYLIGTEAYESAQYWTRELQQLRHTVKLISPRFVKPSVKGKKNDNRDASISAVAG
jgi:hypothetical protein